MNFKEISNKIKGLVSQQRELSRDPEMLNVYGHVQLFAILDLRLEETNRLLSEQNKLLKSLTAQGALAQTAERMADAFAPTQNGDGDAD